MNSREPNHEQAGDGSRHSFPRRCFILPVSVLQLSLVEAQRGSSLIGPEVQSVAGAGNLMPYSSHARPPTRGFKTQNTPIEVDNPVMTSV